MSACTDSLCFPGVAACRSTCSFAMAGAAAAAAVVAGVPLLLLLPLLLLVGASP